MTETATKERVHAIDVVRGFAVLGILKINIAAFALPSATEYNLNARGDMHGWNLAVWCFDALFAEGRMRTLFCMLFGAGLWLAASRREPGERGDGFADFWIRRNLWLVLIGIVHAYLLLWRWDILYYYGLTGLLLYPFRNLEPRRILVLVVAWVLLGVGVTVAHYRTAQETIRKGEAVLALDADDDELSREQLDAVDSYDEQQRHLYPPVRDMEEEIRQRRGGYGANFALSAKFASESHRVLPYGSDLFGLMVTMLFGIALLRLGILDGKRSSAFYRRLVLCAYGIGLPAQTLVCWLTIREGFEPLALRSFLVGGMTYEPLRFLVALGHIGTLMLMLRSEHFRVLTSRLAAVGKMALSNYLAQTVLCSFVFYGFGLGLFGKLSRLEMFGVCLAIWLTQLVVSPLWLARFRFGPVEWLWRSLTRWQVQPIRLPAPRAAIAG